MKPSKPIAPKLRARLLKSILAAAFSAGNTLESYYHRSRAHAGNQKIRNQILGIKEKKDAGLVTKADFDSESAALSILTREFPHFELLTEERYPQFDSKALQNAPKGRFIMDPLDGTTNFIFGFPVFCVSIAAQIESEIEIGLIYAPMLKELFIAERGLGAQRYHVTPKGRISLVGQMKVSQTSKLKDSLLTTGFTYRKKSWLKKEMKAFEILSQKSRAIRRPGSAALDLAFTASGVFDGFWERRLSPWDVAAGILMVKEAGGKVTDFSGKDYELGKPEILATNRQLHRQLLGNLKS